MLIVCLLLVKLEDSCAMEKLDEPDEKEWTAQVTLGEGCLQCEMRVVQRQKEIEM